MRSGKETSKIINALKCQTEVYKWLWENDIVYGRKSDTAQCIQSLFMRCRVGAVKLKANKGEAWFPPSSSFEFGTHILLHSQCPWRPLLDTLGSLSTHNNVSLCSLLARSVKAIFCLLFLVDELFKEANIKPNGVVNYEEFAEMVTLPPVDYWAEPVWEINIRIHFCMPISFELFH